MAVFLADSQTYTTSSTATSSSTTASSATSTTRWSTTATFASRSTLTSACSTLTLLASWLGLAGKLNRDLAIKDLLAGEFSNGTLSLARGGEVDEGISNWAVGAWVLWDRGGFTVAILSAADLRTQKFLRVDIPIECTSDPGLTKGE
jgi:hypothetical protein